MRHLTCGIVAHVDAGKTTLIESMLYLSGRLRKQGRVDHQDAFLDFDEQERKRGITIYSKEAGIQWDDTDITLIDTPGHVDFSAEMERSLRVLDCAILLVSALDGVQSHTETIWKCLAHYHVPVIVFVNKMDISRLSREDIMKSLHERCSDQCIDMESEEALESAALSNEEALNEFLETGEIPRRVLQEAVERRELFPVYFGSALKNEGVRELMNAMCSLVMEKKWPEEFGARVYKITNEPDGTRLAHMKITGGKLKARDRIRETMKADQIRVYSGRGFNLVQEAEAGQVCAVKGVDELEAGAGLGFEKDETASLLSPSLSYQLLLPEGCDPVVMMAHCKILMMEDPALNIEYDPETKKIFVHLMGEIQMEVLEKKIFERSGFHTAFGDPAVVFMETITDTTYGYGHFEPLRHYAEVHLKIEPLERGKGIEIVSGISQDDFPGIWQKQILSSLSSAHLRGVLTNSPLTDVRITLINGAGSNKHTAGGDFRQASLRALKQGLKKDVSILLEPYFSFRLQVESALLSRALYDLEQRHASVSVQELENGNMLITGTGPVRELMNYQSEVRAYTRGMGVFETEPAGYDICRDPKPVIEKRNYDSELDRHSPSGSVFCSGGAGYYVPWDEVEEHLHLPVYTETETVLTPARAHHVSEEDMKYFFNAAGGRNVNQKKQQEKQYAQEKKKRAAKRKELSMEPSVVSATIIKETLLVVDGYNMIFGWETLRDLGHRDFFTAREALISALVDYTGYKGWKLLLVFDGYKPKENHGQSYKQGNTEVVYTRHGQSADSYIEKAVHDMAKKYNIITASSDSLIQNSALGAGSSRISARELENRVAQARQKARDYINGKR